MILRGETRRLDLISDEVMRLIGDAIGAASQDKIAQDLDIATDGPLEEEEVIQKLTELTS